MKNPSLYRSTLARSKRRGFTLSEMAIALGIIGMVIAAIWVAASSVGLNNQVNQAAQELQTVVNNMLPLYQGRAWPPTVVAGCPDITGNAINAAAIPSSNVTGACTASQVWSGAGSFTISANAGGLPSSTFRISFSNVPLQGCVALLMQATGCDPSQAGCPVQVQTSGAPLYVGSPPPTSGWQGILTVTKATTLCNLSGSAGPVAFDFKL